MLHSTLVEEFTATSAMLDVGCLIRLLENRLSLGASVQNLGEPLKYVDVGDPLPRVVRIGASTSIRLMRQPVTVALDVVRWRGENVNIHIGIEQLICEVLSVRCGYRTGYELESVSFGFGLDLGRFHLGYGFGPMDTLNAIQIVELSCRF